MSNQKPKGVGDVKITLKDLDDFFLILFIQKL